MSVRRYDAMHKHFIIRESQFTLSENGEQRRFGISPKAVRVDIVLETGGPVRMLAQRDGPEEVYELRELHTMFSVDTVSPARVHHICLQETGPGKAHGTLLVWGHFSE